MKEETITTGMAMCIVIMFTLGTTLFMGTASEAANDSWISVLLATGMAVPLYMIYARLQSIYPGLDLYDILCTATGPVIGRVLSCLYIWFAIHLGSLVLRNFGEFISTIALTETPMLVPMLFVILLCIWTVRAGIEVLGRSAKLLMMIIIAIAAIILFLSISRFEFHYIRPVLGNGWYPTVNGAIDTFAFPFAEVVLCMSVFGAFKKSASSYQTLLWSLLISGGVILSVTLRNLYILGPDILSSLYFPSYVAVSRISVGDILQRIEGSTAILFVTTLFIKVNVCLYAASKGIAKVFALKSHRSVTLQTGLIMVYLADFIYTDTLEMVHFAAKYYRYYAFPFEVLIPLLVLCVAELRTRRNRSRKQILQPE